MRPTRSFVAIAASALLLVACQDLTRSVNPASARTPDGLMQGNPIPTWQYAMLTLPAGTWTGSVATGINTTGTMTGYVTGSSGPRPVWWVNNSPATLVTPGPNFAGAAYDVNASNVVVGSVWYFAAAGGVYPRTPARWSSGAFSNLPHLGYAGEALAVNDDGTIVGYSRATSASAEHPVKWTSAGTLVDLLPLGATSGRAVDINAQGDVVGSVVINGTPFGWKWGANGVISNLGSLQPVGGITGQVNGVDDTGRQVGRQAYANVEQAVYWSGSSTPTPIPGAAPASIANASSPLQRITGTNANGAFTWRADAGPVALPVPSGTTYSVGVNVNSCGSMVGRADVSGVSKAIRWKYSGGCDTP